jgi:hypothetical protein
MELQIAHMDANTVNIIDYRLKNDSLAKILVSYTGKISGDQLTAKLCAKLKGAARPIPNSFKQVKAGLAVGFIRANQEVVALPSKEKLSAGYRVMASNIFMDKDDQRLCYAR